MSTDTQKTKKVSTKKDGTPRKPRTPRVKVDMTVPAGLDFAAQLQAMGGTPTWISSAGSMEDASTWLPTEPGAELVGIHAGVLEQGVNQKYYKIAVSDGNGGVEFKTTKAGMGNKRLGSISPGKAVRIVYRGVEKTNSKVPGDEKSYRNFDVFQTAR